MKSLNSSHVKKIELIVATQDIESWLFADVDNIYKYLRTPLGKRNLIKYANYEKFTNRDLSKLFREHGRRYKKGKKSDGLIKTIDIDRICSKCKDLSDSIISINKLCK